MKAQEEKKQESEKRTSLPTISSQEVATNFVDNRPETQRALQLKKSMEEHSRNKSLQFKSNKTGLPDQLKSGVEQLSGHSMDDVKVHYNSDKPAQLNAHAYAQGTDIHIASGQEKHLPHEAWHVVQQKQGRVKPTFQMKGKVNVNDEVSLEREADVMGKKAWQMKTKDNSPIDSKKTVARFRIPSTKESHLVKPKFAKFTKSIVQAQFEVKKATAWEDQGVGRVKNAGIRDEEKILGEEKVIIHFHANNVANNQFDVFTATFIVPDPRFPKSSTVYHYNIRGTVENMQGTWSKNPPSKKVELNTPKWADEAEKIAVAKLENLCA